MYGRLPALAGKLQAHLRNRRHYRKRARVTSNAGDAFLRPTGNLKDLHYALAVGQHHPLAAGH